MAECKLCKERQTEINRILRSYAKDKKVYRYVILGSFILNLLILAFGADGLTIALNFVKDIIK